MQLQSMRHTKSGIEIKMKTNALTSYVRDWHTRFKFNQ